MSASEIEKHRFRERFRGYDPDEVDAFLDRVVSAMKTVEQERDEARRERDETRGERDRALDEAHRAGRETAETEELLRKTLVTAQRTAEQTVAEAHADAERIRARGSERAERIVTAARQQARDVADAIEGLLGVHGQLRDAIRDVLERHAALLDREGQLPATADVIAQLRELAEAPVVDHDNDTEGYGSADGPGDDRAAHPGGDPEHGWPEPPEADGEAGEDESAASFLGLEIEPPPPRRPAQEHGRDE